MDTPDAVASGYPRDRVRIPLLAPALLVGLSLGWGTNWPVMKVALAEIPPWTFRGWSLLVAGTTLLAFARLAWGVTPAPPRAQWRGLGLATLLNVTVWNILSAYGVERVAAGHAVLLNYTMPLWVVLFSRLFLGEPITWRSGLAVALGLAGILALMRGDLAALGGAPAGVAFCLAAAVTWAIGTLVQKAHRSSLPTLVFTGYQLLLGSLPLLAIAPLVEGLHFPRASAAAWLAAASSTFIALAFCYVAWFEMLRLLPARAASVAVLLVPVVGVITGALFLGEPFGARELQAMGCIGSALALTLFAHPETA